MLTESTATLNLSHLLHHDVGDDEVSGSGLLMPEAGLLEADDLRLAEPLAWELTVRSAGGDDDFVLSGQVSGVAILECRRCLEDVPVTLAANFIYPMSYRPNAGELRLIENGEDEADSVIFGRPDVDFAELLTQVFAIDLPLTALCRESCRGLSSDGLNLNEHPELEPSDDAKDKPRHSPFEALKDLDV